MADIYGKGGGSGYGGKKTVVKVEDKPGDLLKRVQQKHTQIDTKPAEPSPELSSTKVDEEEG